MKVNSTIILRKLMVLCFVFSLNVNLFSQNRIELNSGYRGPQMTEDNLNGFKTVFSYDCIEIENVETEMGNFAKLVVSDAVPCGEVGSPSLPVTKKLIAVPYGATPVVKVVGYSTTEYDLREYGVERVFPEQPSYSKSAKPEEMVFHYNEKAYQTRSHSDAPMVNVEILGTMRGVQVGSLQVAPVSYNPSNNTIRVYNNIELSVIFEGADLSLTEESLIDSYSPYFDVVYKQLYNSRALNDVFEEHPDLYETPVHMAVVANSMFEEAIQPWLEWKTKKGFYVDVKYVESTTSSSQVLSYIRKQYNDVKPSFVVIIGDSNKVVPSMPAGQETSRVTDLYYGSIDGDYFPELYCSRMSCETVAELENLLEKILQYEQYTMPDPTYLGNALMIAGADDYWNSRVGTPSINYATSFFFNQAHGMDNVYKYTNSYSGCYNNMNTGVGFVNYTAHGVEVGWVDPAFNTSDVAALTNKDKYFWAMGNCCLSGDWGFSGTSFGETMIRAKEKGAWGYIGSCPVTYWNEDYYFTVGATSVFGTMPNKTQTELGVYEALWMDDVYATLSSVPYVGNLSVTNARSNLYTSTNGISTHYYWEAYHTLGDGSVMPFLCEPTENNVSHLEGLPMGLDFFSVTAEPSSYVAISKDGELLGTAKVDDSGTANVSITPVVDDGEITIVVTHPRHIPYVKNIFATPVEGPYVSVFSCNPESYPVNQENKMTLTVKNVGVDATEETATVTLSSDSEYITFTDSSASFSNLDSKATYDLVDEFAFVINVDAVDQTPIVVDAKIECGESVWENKFSITTVAPVVNYNEFIWGGSFEPGGSYEFEVSFKNDGHYKATNANVVVTANDYVKFENTSYEIGTIEAGETEMAKFNFTIDESCPFNERIPVNFVLSADNGVVAEGNDIMMNSCKVIFTLTDSYGDGWGKSCLKVEFDDGTPEMTIEMKDGKEYVETLVIATGTTVTVSFVKGPNSYECQYRVEYEDGKLIYESIKDQPVAGVNKEFVVDCTSVDPADLKPIQNLVVKIESGNVVLTWNAPRYDVKAYKILRDDKEIGETTETTYTDSDVTNGTYDYSVVAVYAEGESEPVTLKVIVGESVEELMNNNFKVYPNPAKDVIYVKSEVHGFEYQLLNNIGQVIASGKANGNQAIQIDNITKGVYFLKLVADGEMKITKVMVQ